MKIKEFDAKVCEAIGFYVYALRDPRCDSRSDSVFYIGKGVGNRCFRHIEEARANLRTTEKLETIREIHGQDLDVQIEVVRHGLEESVALEIEAALIDLLDLTNLVRGHDSTRGLVPARELQVLYGAKELQSREPLLLVKINRLYRQGMTIDEVYEAVRWCWKMDFKRARKAHYVPAVANGIVRGVFKPTRFAKVTESDVRHRKDVGRVYFDGHPVESPYLLTSTRAFGQRGQANPIRYVNM